MNQKKYKKPLSTQSIEKENRSNPDSKKKYQTEREQNSIVNRSKFNSKSAGTNLIVPMVAILRSKRSSTGDTVLI